MPFASPEEDEEMAVFTCLTAPGESFDRDEFHEHYRSEFHRYNLRRKVAQLEMVSRAEFEARRAASAAIPVDKSAIEAHVKPSKREARRTAQKKERRAPMCDGQRMGAGAVVSDAVFRGYKQAVAAPSSEPHADAAEVEAAAAAATAAASVEGEPEEVFAEARAEDSFFDNRQFASAEEALEYMQKEYGFQLPEAQYLSDVKGVSLYLCEKVKQHRVCLYCNKQFRCFFAAQQHMIDKAHCKLAYDTDDAIAELTPFYDFTASYDDIDEQDARDLAPDDDDDDDAADAEGWETASESDDGDGAERSALALTGDASQSLAAERRKTRKVPKVKVLESGELLLKRGGMQKIIGVRWLRKYYKQNFRLEDERESTLCVRREQNERLITMYTRAGLPITQTLGFLQKGLAAQWNRGAAAMLKRDERTQVRKQQANMGLVAGRAKHHRGNNLIKNATAGKNRGEGLGVHG